MAQWQEVGAFSSPLSGRLLGWVANQSSQWAQKVSTIVERSRLGLCSVYGHITLYIKLKASFLVSEGRSKPIISLLLRILMESIMSGRGQNDPIYKI